MQGVAELPHQKQIVVGVERNDADGFVLKTHQAVNPRLSRRVDDIAVMQLEPGVFINHLIGEGFPVVLLRHGIYILDTFGAVEFSIWNAERNQNKHKIRLILLSFVMSIVLSGVKFLAYYLTDSNAILSDALESIINVFASGFAFYSIRLSAQPKDTNHPYGHGKIEFFFGGIRGRTHHHRRRGSSG